MLELSGLSKRFGPVVALDDCTLSVDPGRMVGFLGPNGAGKTTAMRSIFGLVRLDAGHVRWRGRSIAIEESRRFGYMPESRGLYPKMPVRAQVEYLASLHGLSRSDARKVAGEWLERLGLGARGDSRVEELSHGNQQRVQLAVSLAHRPDLLVLDEPFAGLDPLGVETLGELVRAEAARGAAVLFSSHQLDLVQDLCDDVAVIHRGHIVLSGSLREVRTASPYRYASLAGMGARDPRWVAAVAGASVVEQRDGSLRVRVPASTPANAVLEAVESAGALEAFSYEPPSLSDLFLEAVRE